MEIDNCETNPVTTTLTDSHVTKTVEVVELINDAYLSRIERERFVFSSLPVNNDVLEAVVDMHFASDDFE